MPLYFYSRLRVKQPFRLIDELSIGEDSRLESDKKEGISKASPSISSVL
jgi:hypothetical protein